MRRILLAVLACLAAGQAFAQTPTVTTPTVRTPAPSTPSVGTPTVNSPTVNAPTVNTPTVNTPAPTPPTVGTPTVRPPTVGTSTPTTQTPTISAPNLSGEWEGTFGIGNGQQQSERVRVVQQGTSMTATKITGDQFVPAGQITIIAEVTGRSFAGSQRSAQAGFVNPDWVAVTLTLLDENTLRIDGPGGPNWPVSFWRRLSRR